MTKTFYPAILEPASDGFNVFFPDFDGCTSGGDTATEAALNAADALALFLDDWTGPLPAPSSLDAPLVADADPLYRVLIPFEAVSEPELAAA